MAIEFKKNFYNKFSREDLELIQKFRLGSMVLIIIVLILNIIVYLSVTFLGFTYWGSEGFFFKYSVWLNIINTSYYLTWGAMIISFICILSHSYLLKFTINIHFEILLSRKDEDKKEMVKEIQDFKKPIMLRVLGQFSMIGIMLIHMVYYPQNVRLFYPYIGCDVLTDTCVVTSNVVNSFVMAMTGFLIILIVLGFSLIIVNLQEFYMLRTILNPVLAKRKADKEEERKNQLEEYRTLSIEERRQIKIKKIRESRQKKAEIRRGKLDKKYSTLIDKEQYGKSGYRKLKKTVEAEEKEKQVKKPKKDDFDFT